MSDPRQAAPLVTVSLVTHNGLAWLPGCLASLAEQDCHDFELLVLDNASTDGTLEWLASAARGAARMTFQASARNLGFAAAHNRHIRRARGRYVLLLNQDVELDSQFISAAVAALERRPRVGALQPRLHQLLAPGRRGQSIDTTGLVMRRDRRAVSRRQGQPQSWRDLVPGPVWGADGPAPIYRRAALLDARVALRRGGWEVLDEDFFMYKEDVDLAWRLRLLGWQSWYEPAALGWHARTAAGSASSDPIALVRARRSIPRWIRATSWRNQRLMQVKNERLDELMRDLPWVVAREALSVGLAMVTDVRQLASVASLVSTSAGAMAKRRHALARRRQRLRKEVISRADGNSTGRKTRRLAAET